MIVWDGILQAYGDRALFVYDDGVVHYRDFIEMVRASTGTPVDPDRALPCQLEWRASAFADFLSQVGSGQSLVLEGSRDPVDISGFPSGRPLMILRSGGTTGAPKHVVHSFQTLTAPYTLQKRGPHRILVLYAPNHIAGLDAFFQALHRGSTLVVPAGGDVASVGRAVETHGVDVLPATPTYLQFLLLGGIYEQFDLSGIRVIPHGAEPMPANLRKRLQKAFPNAVLLHRFGLTETGALPVRPDPDDPDAFFLDQPGYGWRLVDGEIHILGKTPFLGTLEGGPIPEGEYWHPTGDLGELTRTGSMRILGRREFMINVGGQKVFPETVEALLMNQPGVLDASVSGEASALTGQTVAARVVLGKGMDTRQLLRGLRQEASARGLSLAHVPTRITAVQSIQKTVTGKRSRIQGKA
jgi:acyl-coenzyme A synthetase/AMP-(fatty) acid ligase